MGSLPDKKLRRVGELEREVEDNRQRVVNIFLRGSRKEEGGQGMMLTAYVCSAAPARTNGSEGL